MTITTICNGCGKTLAVGDEFAGRKARCPECRQVYTVPGISLGSNAGPNTGSNIGSNIGPSSSSSLSTAPLDTAPLDLGWPVATPTPENVSPSAGRDPAAADAKFWMKASDGSEYGPVDSATLERWFLEGRVGTDYRIRQGENSLWQAASFYQPQPQPQPLSMSPLATGANPYAAHSTYTVGSSAPHVFAKSDQSGLVLAMGILGWLGMCPIFGIIAWVVGSQALTDINSGNADPSNRGIVQLGYYLGMINCLVWVGCGAMGLLLIAFA